MRASVVVASGFQSAGSVVMAHKLNCSMACGIFLDPGIKPVSAALAGAFLSTVPPGKSCRWYFLNSILLFPFYIFLCVGFLYILEFITLLFEDLTQLSNLSPEFIPSFVAK